MAVLTFLFSFIAKQANNIIQAIFGWSITALFGRLQHRAKVLVTIALVLSLVWPLFVLGVFAPRVSMWAVALVPLHHWIGGTALRLIWLGFAVAAPIGVGALIRVAAGNHEQRLLVALLHGYPLALGFFAAFMVVVVTVPAVKIASLVRHWSDEHVYVQPHDGAYDDVLACLVEAVRASALEPEVSDAPRSMVFATTIMRALAGGAVTSFVAARLRRVTAPGLELYLYPGDLLLRGEPFAVARVRAMIARTKLDAKAYLVDSDQAKAIQEILSRLTIDLDDALARGTVSRHSLADRLKDVYRTLLHADVSYADWLVLDGLATRLERRMIVAHLVTSDALPIDEAVATLHLGIAHDPRLMVRATAALLSPSDVP